jgi:hypothetical protein
MLGMYDLTEEQEGLALELIELVETPEDGWTVRGWIEEMEAANG